MTKEEIQNVSFQIISYAGDAFADFYEAVELAKNSKFDESEECMKRGETKLNDAHNTQTSLLTVEATGDDVPFSIMLIHAQDHLMTTIMYQRMAKQMIDICKKYER